jgi:cytochrome-b5 reductase
VKDKAKSAVGASASVATALDPQNWQSFKLRDVRPYNHDTSVFVFELPPGQVSGLSICSA